MDELTIKKLINKVEKAKCKRYSNRLRTKFGNVNQLN